MSRIKLLCWTPLIGNDCGGIPKGAAFQTLSTICSICLLAAKCVGWGRGRGLVDTAFQLTVNVAFRILLSLERLLNWSSNEALRLA